jgi:hypothetical protein
VVAVHFKVKNTELAGISRKYAVEINIKTAHAIIPATKQSGLSSTEGFSFTCTQRNPTMKKKLQRLGKKCVGESCENSQ